MNFKILLALLTLTCLPLNAQDAEHHRLTNLPHLYINTFNGRDITSKSTEVYARLWLVDEDDQVAFYDSVLIRGRGNSTWGLEKKPYRIKFPEKRRFLGPDRANAKKWTLLANHGDKTLFRNALASYVGDVCGQVFTPGAKFVDLTLNNQYRGNYQISDQIEVRKRRVDVSEQDYPFTSQSDYTGGYLVEADGFAEYIDGISGWQTNVKGVPMTIHYPDEDEIGSIQFTYIRNFVNSFENRLFNVSFESTRGYHNYVDSLSLISWYLANEITANPDYVWSTYFYKEKGDQHLYFGPLWDHDIAFDNDNRLENRDHRDPSRELIADIAFTNNGMEQWIQRMWEDDWFKRLVFDQYSKLYQNGLLDLLIAKVDSLSELLNESQQLNYQRWNIRQRTLREVVIYSTYDEYVEFVRRFLRVRIPALMQAFSERHPDHPDPEDYVTIDPDIVTDPAIYYSITNIGTNTLVDVDPQGLIVANHKEKDSHSQQWQIITLSNGFHFIVNRLSGMALTDPTQGPSTATTNLSTQLSVAPADSADRAQQWHLVLQDNGRINLNNRKSDHTANLTGGSPDDGTTILSYTNDSRNSASSNRLWTLEEVDRVPTAIEEPRMPDVAYALAYDPTSRFLHFGADDLSQLKFEAQVYDAAGRPRLRFNAEEGCSVANLPRGLYVVAWQWQGSRHTAKFMIGE